MKSAAQILINQSMTPSGVQKENIRQKYARTNSTSQTSSTCNGTDNSKKRIEQLFTRFAVFYGHLWRSQFKSDGFLEFAKKEWSEGLEQFSDEVLNQVILMCRDHCEMPPSLPQIIGLCRDIKRRKTFYVAGKQYQLASKEVVEKNIELCKAYLFK